MARETQMKRSINEVFSGWEISLERNVHMYTHDLSVSKGHYRIDIDCEDLPTTEKTIGVWLHNLDISFSLKKELQEVLQHWSNQFDVKFQIYIVNDKFVTNKY